jgi:hypothetical protein
MIVMCVLFLVLLIRNQICFSDSRFQNQNGIGDFKIKIGFLNSNFKKGFCLGKATIEMHLGDTESPPHGCAGAQRHVTSRDSADAKAKESP